MARHDTVPIKDYVDVSAAWLIRVMGVGAAGILTLVFTLDRKNATAIDTALSGERLARTVALAEIKGTMSSHNDLIRKSDQTYSATKAEMVTKAEFRPIAEYVSQERGSAITSTKFIGYLFATATLFAGIGFGVANLLQ